MKIENLKLKTIFVGIFLLASFFRLYGVNWDQGQHLHPDERFLTMVANGISWPKSFSEYLDAQISPLNPQNRGFSFFVYGTFPIFFTKWVAENLGQGDYGNLTLVGRRLSAFADLGTVLLVFLIGKSIKTKLGHLKLGYWVIGLLSMFLYSVMVLPIQLSHFYAVDTYLTFFITLCFYFIIKLINSVGDSKQIKNTSLLYSIVVLSGVSFGLALASKISSVLFLPIIGLGFFSALIKIRNFKLFLVLCFMFYVACYLTFRLAQPYTFANADIFDISLNQKVLDNWRQLKSFDDPTGGFPPAVQWITTKPYLFPLKNMVLWGLGLPLGIISILATFYSLKLLGYWVIGLFRKKQSTIRQLADQQLTIFLSLLWILLLFIYQGGQFVKALRYFFPFYPFLAIITGYFIVQIINKFKIGLPASPAGRLGYLLIGLLLMIYPLSFLSIYSHPNSRVTASYWIYSHIPAGSTLTSEEWDDGLPVSINSFIHEQYKSVQLPLYWPDTPEKWKLISNRLQQADYVIETSNRLYGSIMTFPAKYPASIRYYQALFDGSLGFEKIAEFTSRPNLPVPGIKICLTPPFVRYGIVALPSQECNESGISFVDDYADETFTVYDHPKVTIFKKVKDVDYLQVLKAGI